MTKFAIVTVYFEGTSNSLSHCGSQIGLFDKITSGESLLELEVGIDNDGDGAQEVLHYKAAFDGCGVTYGLFGTLFAVGLKAQAALVARKICQLIGNKSQVVLNAVGFSRGAIASLHLAKMLSSISSKYLHMNLILFDPIPGNFLSVARYLDPCNLLTANSSKNLQQSKNLCDILALYPHMPLPDYSFHAPLFPLYPVGCNLTEDVVLGCHQDSLLCSPSDESRLSFTRIYKWLIAHRTSFIPLSSSDPYSPLVRSLLTSEEKCLRIMERALQQLQGAPPTIRFAHGPPDRRTIYRNSSHGKGGTYQYLNKWHAELQASLDRTPPLCQDGSSVSLNKPEDASNIMACGDEGGDDMERAPVWVPPDDDFDQLSRGSLYLLSVLPNERPST
jgi:hypothetical protein